MKVTLEYSKADLAKVAETLRAVALDNGYDKGTTPFSKLLYGIADNLSPRPRRKTPRINVKESNVDRRWLAEFQGGAQGDSKVERRWLTHHDVEFFK